MSLMWILVTVGLVALFLVLGLVKGAAVFVWNVIKFPFKVIGWLFGVGR